MALAATAGKMITSVSKEAEFVASDAHLDGLVWGDSIHTDDFGNQEWDRAAIANIPVVDVKNGFVLKGGETVDSNIGENLALTNTQGDEMSLSSDQHDLYVGGSVVSNLNKIDDVLGDGPSKTAEAIVAGAVLGSMLLGVGGLAADVANYVSHQNTHDLPDGNGDTVLLAGSHSNDSGHVLQNDYQPSGDRWYADPREQHVHPGEINRLSTELISGTGVTVGAWENAIKPYESYVLNPDGSHFELTDNFQRPLGAAIVTSGSGQEYLFSSVDLVNGAGIRQPMPFMARVSADGTLDDAKLLAISRVDVDAEKNKRVSFGAIHFDGNGNLVMIPDANDPTAAALELTYYETSAGSFTTTQENGVATPLKANEGTLVTPVPDQTPSNTQNALNEWLGKAVSLFEGVRVAYADDGQPEVTEVPPTPVPDIKDLYKEICGDYSWTSETGLPTGNRYGDNLKNESNFSFRTVAGCLQSVEIDPADPNGIVMSIAFFDNDGVVHTHSLKMGGTRTSGGALRIPIGRQISNGTQYDSLLAEDAVKILEELISKNNRQMDFDIIVKDNGLPWNNSEQIQEQGDQIEQLMLAVDSGESVTDGMQLFASKIHAFNISKD